MQNRLKSPVVLASVVAQVLAILLALGAIDAGQSEAFNAVVSAVLQLLVVFGILNNPENPSGF